MYVNLRESSSFVSSVVAILGAGALVLGIVGCAGASGAASDDGSDSPASITAVSGADSSVSPVPTGTGFDYQLGGAYDAPDGVGVVARDRSAAPLEDGYSICYVNAFQTQPGDTKLWKSSLLLKKNGNPVTDPDWPDEILLDTSTASKRADIVKVLTPWIKGCARSGYAAVEFDNLDSYTRSGKALKYEHNAALAKSLVEVSHESGLAAAQKNVAERSTQLKRSAGFDLVVAEECAANEECAQYSSAYGTQVVDVEYTDNLPTSFSEMCKKHGAPELMILRDRDLLTPDEDGYVYEPCN